MPLKRKCSLTILRSSGLCRQGRPRRGCTRAASGGRRPTSERRDRRRDRRAVLPLRQPCACEASAIPSRRPLRNDDADGPFITPNLTAIRLQVEAIALGVVGPIFRVL